MAKIEEEMQAIGLELLNHFGIEAQLMKFVEESSELVQLIARFDLGHRVVSIYDLIEEVVDNYIVLSSIVEFYQKDDRFIPLAKDKIEKAGLWLNKKEVKS